MADEIAIPLMAFAGVVDGAPVSALVAWAPSTGVFCNCAIGDDGCAHVQYYGSVSAQPLVRTEDLSRDEMETLTKDPRRLRRFMLERVPVIDINDPQWSERTEIPAWTDGSGS